MKVKSDPKIGYMNRMKKLWEEIRPEMTFPAKNLRNQARRVEKSRVVMETKQRIDKNQNNSNVVNNGSTETIKDIFMQNITSINSMNFPERN